MRQKIPYAQVTGVDTEDDIVSALTSIAQPISFNEFQGLGIPTNTPLGCFLQGAGTLPHFIFVIVALIHVHVDANVGRHGYPHLHNTFQSL